MQAKWKSASAEFKFLVPKIKHEGFENQERFPVWGLVRTEILFIIFIAGKFWIGGMGEGWPSNQVQMKQHQLHKKKIYSCQSHDKMPVWMSCYKRPLKNAQVKTLMTLTFYSNGFQTDVTKLLLFEIIYYILVICCTERTKRENNYTPLVDDNSEKYMFRIRSVDLHGLYPKQILIPQMVSVALREFFVLSGCI